eukprot:1240887-Rhodomonas_salina.1
MTVTVQNAVPHRRVGRKHGLLPPQTGVGLCTSGTGQHRYARPQIPQLVRLQTGRQASGHFATRIRVLSPQPLQLQNLGKDAVIPS